MFEELRGRCVLITGASTGIGAAVARGFGRCGARIGVHYNKNREQAEAVVEDVRAAGGEGLTLQGDVTVKDDVRRFIDEAAEALGRIDVLINNAGDLVKRAPFEDASDELIDFIMALNARSVVTVCRQVLPHFRRHGRGSIINTTSVAARQAGGPDTSIYTASKAFAQGLTRFLARQYASHGIRVNAVAPGLIQTPLQDRNTTPEQLAAMTRGVPMGRVGQPEDCVGAYLFLAADALSGYVTGATIDVNGGLYLS
jgi:3-oxoacyl-[acyl-carrier protein] reductase